MQPDNSYYLANYAQIAAKDMDAKADIDLLVDPPPDLVIEVVNTHPATEAVEVCRRLGVPEVWVCHTDGLRILIRQANGRYQESPTSASFPFLSALEIFDWVARPGMDSVTQWGQGITALGPRNSHPQSPGTIEHLSREQRTRCRRFASLILEIPSAGARFLSALPLRWPGMAVIKAPRIAGRFKGTRRSVGSRGTTIAWRGRKFWRSS